VEIVGYYNIVDGVSVTAGTRFVSPETLVFVSAEASPTGRPVLLAGYEGVDGSISGSVAVLEIVPSTARIVNASIRTTAAANQTVIVGFDGTGAENVLMRGVGPGLTAFGVAGAVEDPRLALFKGSVQIGANDNWAGSPELVTAANTVGAFALTPTSKDAALLSSVSGALTLHLTAPTAGASLVEVYGLGAGARFSNLSVRSMVSATTGPLIGGFVVAGSGTKTVLIRAVGPRLSGFGVTGALADPRLEIYRGGIKVGENDDWAQGTTAGDFAAAGAFPLGTDTKSAAVRLTITPGAAYTVHVSGTAGTAGEALLEIYEIK